MLEFVQQYDGQLQINESLVQVDGNGYVKLLLTNVSGSTCKLEKGEFIGLAFDDTTVSEEEATLETVEAS